MIKRNSFILSEKVDPHHIRAKEILKEYPEIRTLIQKNPKTLFFIIGLVLLQILITCFIAEQSWWLVLGVAYVIGACIDHALFVLIHECTHKLLFKKPILNRLAAMFANIPQILPSAISFERYHLKHHAFMGVHELDGDLPNQWEAKLINNYFVGKVIWLLFYPFFQVFRIPRLEKIKHFDAWVALNWAVQIIFVVVISFLLGFKAIAFLLISFFFSVGLHPLGARWIQEHYLTHSEQETCSYYGEFNYLAFNVGYHNEHHDFPSIPWNKLPEIRKGAPRFYDTLFYHTSWTKLFLRFLFDKEISLYARIVRKNQHEKKLTNFV